MDTNILNSPQGTTKPIRPFPGFDYAAIALKRFHETAGQYTILLKDGKIVHFEPEKPQAFRTWLQEFEIADTSSFYL